MQNTFSPRYKNGTNKQHVVKNPPIFNTINVILFNNEKSSSDLSACKIN